MAKLFKLALVAVMACFALATPAYANPSPAPTPPDVSHLTGRTLALPPPVKVRGRASAVAGVGTDSVPSFSGRYVLPNFDQNGNPNSDWVYNMLGRDPRRTGTTVLRAPIIPLVIQLLNPDGTVAATDDPHSTVSPALTSPVFFPQSYSSSSVPTQYADAIQRAEFYNSARKDWHTILIPQVMTARVMRVPAGSWQIGQNPDATPLYFVDFNAFINLFIPASNADTTTPMGAAEHAGQMTTKDVTTFLVHNIALYFGSVSPGNCCVLGFHTYDLEPGDASNGNRDRNYVVNFSSWLTGGGFGSAFSDVTALSHEISETFNDPFVASLPATAAVPFDTTPWWLAPNGNCQDNLEVGDVIEGLPNDTYTTTILGRTYHPQNEALLQWFESKTPSDAIGGAYSYPNTSVLPTASVPQKAGCA